MPEPTAQPTAPQRDPRPLDIATMRATTAQLLADGAEPRSPDQLDTLMLQLRGHLILLIPEIEDLADVLPEGDQPRKLAEAGMGEARRRLAELPESNPPRAAAYARRLARSVEALCTHLERLAGNR